MTTTSYEYSSGIGFVYDSSMIGFSGGHALIETESLSSTVAMQFSVVYPFSVSQNIGTPANTFSFGSAVIPNVPEANLATLTFM